MVNMILFTVFERSFSESCMSEMEPRPLPRPRRPRKRLRTPNEEVRRRLMEAASQIIHDHGMPELRVDEVASRAGLSVGTFYLYFEGKEDLFANLVIDYTERLRAVLRAAYEGEGGTIERLDRSLDAYLDFVDENERGFLYFRDSGTVHTTVGRLSSWALDRHADDLRPLIEEGIEAGRYRAADPQLTAQAIVGAVQHIAGWWLENREQCSREQIKAFLLSFTGLGVLERDANEPGTPG